MTDKPIVTPGRPYSARVEYFACREDVEAMLARGYNIRNAYDHMKEQGRVTCSYSAFCDYVRGGGKRQHSRHKNRPPGGFRTLQKAATERGPIIVKPKAENNPFDINSVDVSTLI